MLSPVSAAEQPPVQAAAADGTSVEECLECHEDAYDAISSTAHWMPGDPRTPAASEGCGSCHGDLQEHLLNAGEELSTAGSKTFGKATTLSPAEQNAVCQGCHRSAPLIHWTGSGHDLQEVGCVGCHRIHGEDAVRHEQTQQAVCLGCHSNMRGQGLRPFGHPLREGLMGCGDCHAAHGCPGDADLRTFTVNETCYNCHADKRGPFLWEHAPASEDCLLCHSAHGSIHRNMLSRREPHLCQACHEPTAIANNPLGPHARHSRLALSFRQPGMLDEGPGPEEPGAGIARFVLGEACSNCHNQVHGSNHPAGAKLTR